VGRQDLTSARSRIIGFSNGLIQGARNQAGDRGQRLQLPAALRLGHLSGDRFQVQRLHPGHPPHAAVPADAPVRIDIIYTEAERAVRKQLERKWEQHNRNGGAHDEIIREYGLSKAAMAHTLTRKLGVERVEVRASGSRW
jgi:hypothetical protein